MRLSTMQSFCITQMAMSASGITRIGVESGVFFCAAGAQ